MLTPLSAIITSRKRKLRELFAVATVAESQSHDGFANPDATPSTPAEAHFLQANEIVQGRKFIDQTIPPHHLPPLESLHRSLAALQTPTTLPTPSGEQKLPLAAQPVPCQQTKVSPPQIRPNAATPSHSTLPRAVEVRRPSPPTTSTPVPENATAPTRAAPRPPSTTPITAAQTPPAHRPSSVPIAPAAPTPVSTEAQSQKSPSPPVQTKVAPPPALKSTTSADETSAAAPKPADSRPVESRPAVSGPVAPAQQDNAVSRTKTSLDVPRPADVPSSPESSARSATTPAIHDTSTDTSPDNGGSSHHELPEKQDPKGDRADEGAQGKPADADAHDAEGADSAEDQLIQESLRSSAAARSPGGQKVEAVPAAPAAEPAKSSPQEAEAPSPEKPQNTRPAVERPAVQAVQAVEQVGDSAEIPDSRGNSPEEMDVHPTGPAASAVETAPIVETAPVQPKQEPITDDQAPITPSTPPKQEQTDAASQARQGAVTRVSSGAMRPRSVTEIVAGGLSLDRRPSSSKDEQNQLTPLTSTSSHSPSRGRRPTARKDRQKGQVSAVLFGKHPTRVDEKSVAGSSKDAVQPSDDYYTPLFIQGFARAGSTWMQPLEKILFHANKTVGTADANLAILDHQACKILHRVYHLQSTDKWTLRQPKRCPEPTRPPSHWDMALKEMRWMRTDFREERKWKMAAARNLAEACADWCNASPQERKALQVPAMIPPRSAPADEDVAMTEDAVEDATDNVPTPELVPGDVASPQNADDLSDFLQETVSPSAIFTLHEDDVVFGLRHTAAADQLLGELPVYAPPLKVPTSDPLAPQFDPDASWRRPALPLSKYVEGQMKLISEGPPRKKSRYDYDSDDSDDEAADGGFVSQQQLPSSDNTVLPASTDEVALFRPEMKHIRDRLHAGHQFRPPTDHPMPPQNFYECRHPSQWTCAEDDELRGLVREHSYNWPLISSNLSSRSMYSSGAERRTPWECFERWINLEGMPSDMQKTQYFRTYNSRIESAQRVVIQNQLAAQQAAAAGAAAGGAGGAAAAAAAAQPVRRRQTTPLRVERRRNQKHMALIDAMRKLAKKRETILQKQQQSAAQSAANKKPEPPAQRHNKTPRDYSLIRWERDQALAEKMAAFAQRQDATRRDSSSAGYVRPDES
ncbi:LOW QUALITY PROTEIN: chromatin modification-related protein VID21 [Geosmithia morbida]|uniref:Vacuolar import and degradation protein 21 n=1 Tax=Geosmithia morbida TaxID=1094350 RepID=A0A9P4YV77_9HYPO|nr:LOW QUALITY PROTEIN: chromatin modification-related protein VID21 [Geosmithia morbida]KAF4123132.1 LOW QUALITY PROTEIN: chromatin modification-related protein VID21 [Geosmithia morbida]